jgi:hypothetical protein
MYLFIYSLIRVDNVSEGLHRQGLHVNSTRKPTDDNQFVVNLRKYITNQLPLQEHVPYPEITTF